MDSRCAPTRVGIVRHPNVTGDVPLQYEDVSTPRGNHSRRWRGTGKTQPIGRKIQLGHDATKHT